MKMQSVQILGEGSLFSRVLLPLVAVTVVAFAASAIAADTNDMVTVESRATYQKIMRARTYAELDSLIDEFKGRTFDDQKAAICRLLCQDIRKLDRVAMDKAGKEDGPKHDVSLRSGRSVAALEKLLNTTFSPVSQKSTKEDLARIAREASDKIRDMVMSERMKAIDTMGVDTKREQAGSEHQFRPVLQKLAGDTNAVVRMAVAGNLRTPRQTIRMLAENDQDAEVRALASKTLQSRASAPVLTNDSLKKP